MHNKIEVNEYVRTKDGIIDKVIIEYDGKCNKPNCSEKHISCKYNYYNEKEIVKHSKQLIDLIEVGDVVNKLEIFRVAEYNENYDAKVVYHETDEEAIPITTDEIETVLTHEQYEANCYKVGGEDGI